MAYENDVETVSIPAGVSFAAGQYRAATLNSSGQLVLASAAGRVAGIVQNKPAINEVGSLGHSGVSKMEAGAAVAAGAQVTVDAAGRGITAVSTNYVLGVALEAAGALGVYFPIVITQSGVL